MAFTKAHMSPPDRAADRSITVTSATTSDVSPHHVEHREGVHRNLALLVIASAQLMVVLDATIVNIALPHIKTALNFSPTGLSWVLNSYTLVFGGLLLLGGRAGDLFGRRRMFMTGVLIFALASLAGGFAWDKGWLLAMRALQGVGGAIASPTALSLVTTTFKEGPERNRAFGVYAAVSGAGAAIGLILGGVLTDYLSWRWVLFVNAPIGLAIAVATPYVLGESTRVKGRFALADAVSSTLGMASLVYGFIHAATNGWGNAGTLGSFALAVILLVTFVYMQSRNEQPLMPLRLFANRTRVGAYVVMLIVGAAVFAMFYFLTQYVQNVLGFSPVKAGLAFLPVSATIVVVAQVVSRLMTRLEPKFLIAGGTIFGGLGLYDLSRLTVHSSYSDVLPAIVMIAVGMGSIFVPITLAAVAGVGREDAGVASAMLNVGQQVGGTIGLASLVTVFSHAATAYAKPRHLPSIYLPAPFTHGADAAFLTGSIFMVVGLVAALLLIKIRPGEAAELTPPAA
jgi:EmrB/QacA subfamily drug resistance transporter